MLTASLYLQPDAMLVITAPASTFHAQVKSVLAVFHANWKKLKYRYHCFKCVIVVKKTNKNVEMLSQNRRVTLRAEPTSCFSCERFVSF